MAPGSNRTVSSAPTNAGRTSSSVSAASNAGSLSSWRSRWYPSGKPCSTDVSATNPAAMRPAFARASSAVSGFRFCGMMLEPVVYASSSSAQPSAGSVHRARSAASRERCVAQIDASARNSCTKSRSETASIELSNGRSNPSRSAAAAGSRPSVDVASAPAPSGDTEVRTAH